MSVVKMETMGYDGIFSHVNAGIIVTTEQNFLNEDPDERKFFPDLAIVSIIKNLTWAMVPTFIVFMPLGIFYLFKKRDYKKNSLILFTTNFISLFFNFSWIGMHNESFAILLPPGKFLL